MGEGQRARAATRLRSKRVTLVHPNAEGHANTAAHTTPRTPSSYCPKPSIFDTGGASRTARETLLFVIDRASRGIHTVRSLGRVNLSHVRL